MKKTLNLLPTEVSAIEAPKRGSLYYLIFGACLYITIILSLWVFNLIEYKRTQMEIKTLTQKKAELRAKFALIPKPAAGVAIPIEKEILNELDKAPQWSRIISEISLVVPEDVWLSSIEASQDNESIRFKGYAIKQMGVALFIASIEKSDLFENVEIIYSQKGAKEVSFGLKAKMRWI